MPRTDEIYANQNVVYEDTRVAYPDGSTPSGYYDDGQASYAGPSSQATQQVGPYSADSPPTPYYSLSSVSAEDEQTSYAGPSSQATQQVGPYGAGSADITYSRSSSSEGPDLAPTDRELERRWLEGERAHAGMLKAQTKDDRGRTNKAAQKEYSKYKKSDRYDEYQRRLTAYNRSSPSRSSAPASEIPPSDTRSSRSSHRRNHQAESRGGNWDPEATQLTGFQALQAKYNYPPAENVVQDSLQKILIYTNEYAEKGIDAARIPEETKTWLKGHWDSIPKPIIDSLSTTLTAVDAANSGSASWTATAIRYMAHITQAYQSTAAIGGFLESGAQGRSRLDVLRNTSQAVGVGLDYTTMYRQQPEIAIASGIFKGVVQPGAEAVTQLTEHLHETHLEQRNARRGGVSGDPADANQYASESGRETRGRDRIPAGDSADASVITRPPRARSRPR